MTDLAPLISLQRQICIPQVQLLPTVSSSKVACLFSSEANIICIAAASCGMSYNTVDVGIMTPTKCGAFVQQGV